MRIFPTLLPESLANFSAARRAFLVACSIISGLISFKLVKEHTDDSEIRKIVVEDNGIGMDNYVIEHYFMRIGKSYYQSRDFKKERFQFSPISTFGIGVLSCFMLSDRIEVETLKEGKDPIKLEIATDSEYFVTRKGSRKEPGTAVTLILKDDVELDLIGELKKYARHVKFPISVNDGENTETIVDCGYGFNFVDYINPLYKQYVDELYPYVIDFEKEGIVGFKGELIFMFLRDENGGYGFESKNLSRGEVYEMDIEEGYEGIFRDEIQKQTFRRQSFCHRRCC